MSETIIISQKSKASFQMTEIDLSQPTWLPQIYKSKAIQKALDGVNDGAFNNVTLTNSRGTSIDSGFFLIITCLQI